jgi:hypothetical protein
MSAVCRSRRSSRVRHRTRRSGVCPPVTWTQARGSSKGLSADQVAGIEAIGLDMWEPYVQAIRAHVPEAAAKMVFDRYHIMTHMGRAVDDVRKRDHRALAAMTR